MSLPTVLLPDRRTAGTPDPSQVITVTLGDKTFQAGRRTAAHIEWTIAELARLHPGAHLHVIQPCFNTTVAASAGTHDGDGVLDFRIDGLDWWTGQLFMRRCGWAVWYRHTGSWAATSEWHLHGISIGCPGRVGYYVPAQVDDYYRHAEGLKGEHDSGLDHSQFPPDISSTVFDYPAFLADQEANMPLNKDDLAAISKLMDDRIAAALGGKPDGSTQTRDQLLKQAQKASVEARDALVKTPK